MEQVEIRIRGELAGDWSSWLAGLSIAHPVCGQTVLRGPIRDQAELRGVLDELADLGLALVSVSIVGEEPPARPRPSPGGKEADRTSCA